MVVYSVEAQSRQQDKGSTSLSVDIDIDVCLTVNPPSIIQPITFESSEKRPHNHPELRLEIHARVYLLNPDLSCFGVAGL